MLFFKQRVYSQNKKDNMLHHSEISDTELKTEIRNNIICFGGNKNEKIYGLLSCASGKRLNRDNRVFFTSELEALQNNYRPCGHCMRKDYKEWKNGFI